MAGEICRNCGESNVINDPDTGVCVCESCGCVHDSVVFQHQAFTSEGTPLGTLVHSAGDFGYREQKLHRARASIADLCARLGLSANRADDVAHLACKATDEELGSGEWFPVLVAACAVIVMRQHRSPLSLAEAAAAIGRHPQDLGSMVVRVARHLDLGQLPDLDSVRLLESFVRNFHRFSALDKEKFEEILGQGRFIFQCAMRWFLTTGRHPLSVISAVLAFVANVNGLKISVEEIAAEIRANVCTSRLRLKELMEILVQVSKELLPWGNDVTVKNITKHAPVLIRFMELKSKSKSNPDNDVKNVSDIRINLGDIMNSVSDCIDIDHEESRYFRFSAGDDCDRRFDREESEGLPLSGVKTSLFHPYIRDLDKLPEICNEGYERKKKRSGIEIEEWIESWEGRWQSDKGLTVEQVLQRSEGYDALPPSFINGLEMRRSRRMKMDAAKHRIYEITRRASSGVKEENYKVTELPTSKKRRKRSGAIDELDWEDCVIELLLLHRANEEEIEQGHYSRLLDLYVFSSPVA